MQRFGRTRGIDNAGAGLTADGKVMVTMDIDPADFAKPVVTRASANSNETQIDNVLIYIFEGETRDEAVFTDAVLGTVVSSNQTITAAITPPGQGRYGSS